MREIKFRAWDKEIRMMFYPDGATIYEIIKASDECEDECWLLNTDHELMQYTGLKDKNGVEIYEGDVVTNGHTNFVVKFGNGFDEQTECSFVGFYINSVRLNSYWALTEDVIDEDDGEVIGNIYENPELLEDK